MKEGVWSGIQSGSMRMGFNAGRTSVIDLVWYSLGDSVHHLVRHSTREPVWDSVWISIRMPIAESSDDPVGKTVWLLVAEYKNGI